MRKTLSWLTGAAFALAAMSAANGADSQAAHDEGVQAGKKAQPVIRGFVNEPAARSVLPADAYTTSPPQTTLYGRTNLSADSANRLAYCQSAAGANDISCQATLTGVSSANTPRAGVTPDDPSVLAARASASNPGAQGVSLSGIYSACQTQTQVVTNALYNVQSCDNYYRRDLNNLCQRTLAVEVSWDCPAGAIEPARRAIDPTTGQAGWLCKVQRSEQQYSCAQGWTGPTESWLNESQLTQVCTHPVTNMVAPALLTLVTVVADAPATSSTRDTWNDPCTSLEARVPPSVVPTSNDNPNATVGTTTAIDKCYRTSSICSEVGIEPRVINDVPVTRACWQWTNKYDCVTPEATSDCSQPRFGQCAQKGRSCIEADNTTTPPFCSHERVEFSCKVTEAVTQSVENCGTQTFCQGGTCWDTSHPADPDFARVVAYMEARREAGKYLDQDTLEVFKGWHNTCTKKLLTNCCNQGGTNSSMFTNLSMAMGVGKTLGQAAFSPYTYDALFASDAPDFMIKGFEALFGGGLESSLAGMLAGELTVESFAMAMIPSYWTIIMLAIQLSGIMSCSTQEKATAMKRDARLCVEFGDYCSSCIRVLGKCTTCTERTKSFCCFNSRLSRIVNEQGRQQIAKNWGGDTSRSPDCSGFTVAQLQQLDFSRMDLSEFYADITPQMINAATAAGEAAVRTPTCYYGNGRC